MSCPLLTRHQQYISILPDRSGQKKIRVCCWRETMLSTRVCPIAGHAMSSCVQTNTSASPILTWLYLTEQSDPSTLNILSSLPSLKDLLNRWNNIFFYLSAYQNIPSCGYTVHFVIFFHFDLTSTGKMSTFLAQNLSNQPFRFCVVQEKKGMGCYYYFCMVFK